MKFYGSTYMIVCPSLISADVERGRTGTWQIFRGHLITQISCLIPHLEISCVIPKKFLWPVPRSQGRRPLNPSGKISSLCPRWFCDPPTFVQDICMQCIKMENSFQFTSKWRVLCQFVRMDYLSIVCTASGPSSRALAQVFVSAEVSSLIT